MLKLKKASTLKNENIENMYYELIKMRFLAITQLNTHCIELFQNELRADTEVGEEYAMECVIDSINLGYGSTEKLENLKNSILTNIEILEKGLDNAENQIMAGTDFFIIYDGIYSDAMVMSGFTSAKEEGFLMWYNKKYKTQKGIMYA